MPALVRRRAVVPILILVVLSAACSAPAHDLAVGLDRAVEPSAAHRASATPQPVAGAAFPVT